MATETTGVFNYLPASAPEQLIKPEERDGLLAAAAVEPILKRWRQEELHKPSTLGEKIVGDSIGHHRGGMERALEVRKFNPLSKLIRRIRRGV